MNGGVGGIICEVCHPSSKVTSYESANNATDDTSGEDVDGADGGAELRMAGRVWRVHSSFFSGSSAGVISLSGHWDWGSGSPFSSRRLWRFMYW